MLFPLFVIGSLWFWLLVVAVVISIYVFIDNDRGIRATFTLLAAACALWLFGDFNVFKWIYHNPAMFGIGVVAYFIVGMIWVFFKWEVFCRDRRTDVDKEISDFMSADPAPTLTLDTITVDDFRAVYQRDFSNNQFAVRKDGKKQVIETVQWDGRREARVTLPEPTEEVLAKQKEEWETAKASELKYIYERYNEKIMSRLGSHELVEPDHKGKLGIIPLVRNHKSILVTWMSYWPFSATWFMIHDVVHRICRTLVDMLQKTLQRRADSIFKDSAVGVAMPVAHKAEAKAT